MRRWIVGPEGKSRGRRRGLAARLLDVCSLRRGGRTRRSTRRSRRRGRCRRTAGCSGWPKAIRSGRSRRCSTQVRGTVYARSKAQEAGYGLETELAEPDGALVVGGGGGDGGARGAGAAAGGADAAAGGDPRGCARLARFAGAGAGRRRDQRADVAARDAGRVDRLARAGRRRRPIPISSTGWRSSGSRGANMTSGFTATGSTRPSRWPRRCSSPRTACWSPRRRCAGPRAGRAPRRAPGRCICRRRPAISRRRARSIMPASAEVLIVTDLPRGDIAALAGAYARLIEAAGGRDARAVHRDPAAARGPCADRRPAGARRAAAARPACRPDRHRHAGRHLPRRSARVAARHRRAARRGRRAGRIAAAGGDGAGAVAAPDRAPRGAAAGQWRQRL